MGRPQVMPLYTTSLLKWRRQHDARALAEPQLAALRRVYARVYRVVAQAVQALAGRQVGLGRIVAMYCRSPALYQIREYIR